MVHTCMHEHNNLQKLSSRHNSDIAKACDPVPVCPFPGTTSFTDGSGGSGGPCDHVLRKSLVVEDSLEKDKKQRVLEMLDCSAALRENMVARDRLRQEKRRRGRNRAHQQVPREKKEQMEVERKKKDKEALKKKIEREKIGNNSVERKGQKKQEQNQKQKQKNQQYCLDPLHKHQEKYFDSQKKQQKCLELQRRQKQIYFGPQAFCINDKVQSPALIVKEAKYNTYEDSERSAQLSRYTPNHHQHPTPIATDQYEDLDVDTIFEGVNVPPNYWRTPIPDSKQRGTIGIIQEANIVTPEHVYFDQSRQQEKFIDQTFSHHRYGEHNCVEEETGNHPFQSTKGEHFTEKTTHILSSTLEKSAKDTNNETLDIRWRRKDHFYAGENISAMCPKMYHTGNDCDHFNSYHHKNPAEQGLQIHKSEVENYYDDVRRHHKSTYERTTVNHQPRRQEKNNPPFHEITTTRKVKDHHNQSHDVSLELSLTPLGRVTREQQDKPSPPSPTYTTASEISEITDCFQVKSSAVHQQPHQGMKTVPESQALSRLPHQESYTSTTTPSLPLLPTINGVKQVSQDQIYHDMMKQQSVNSRRLKPNSNTDFFGGKTSYKTDENQKNGTHEQVYDNQQNSSHLMQQWQHYQQQHHIARQNQEKDTVGNTTAQITTLHQYFLPLSPNQGGTMMLSNYSMPVQENVKGSESDEMSDYSPSFGSFLLDTGNLWQGLVASQVKRDYHEHDILRWYHISKDRVRNATLASLVHRDSSLCCGRLLLHILVRDDVTHTIKTDIAIGCFPLHYNSKARSSMVDKSVLDVWMAIRRHNVEKLTPLSSLSTANIESALLPDGVSLEDLAKTNPLGKKPLLDHDILAVYGRKPPIDTLFLYENDLLEDIIFKSGESPTKCPPSIVFLQQYLALT